MDLSDVILMTDDTEVYASAWTHVMVRPARRLLCTWHINRAWRRNLSKVKGDRSTQDAVYKTLWSLMELTDLDVFSMKMHQFVSSLTDDDKTRDFASYFEREYARRPELWAFSHRMGLRVHHNMHLEAMHRVLKHVHMQGQKVRRMDKSIHALMQFMRSKMADRLLKIHKGKWTKHIRAIRSRHQTSLNLSAEAVTCLNSMSYLVKGSGDAVYMVEQCDNMPHAADTCPLMCEECAICIHHFQCNCLDSGLRSTICKHVHLVMRVCSPQLITARSSGSHCPQHGDNDVMDTESLSSDAVPSAAVEETVERAEDFVPLDETTAILASLKQRQPECSLDKLDQLLADVRATIVQNPDLLSDAC